ncbi:hypothetical protein C7C56_005435 [Massilia glaciei]|uniref:Uncharacterized protein n=1 Tax=Massilia glaciei TaxID=1524097 RepID=A0A2U2I515_9BURK|nr:hypothetical protein C7C56_005435 [Massilia glaciei]
MVFPVKYGAQQRAIGQEQMLPLVTRICRFGQRIRMVAPDPLLDLLGDDFPVLLFEEASDRCVA